MLEHQMDSHIRASGFVRICSEPQQTRLFSSYTATRKLLSGGGEGIPALTLYIGQVGESEWTGSHWPVATAVL